MASIDRYRPTQARETYQPPARDGYQPPTSTSRSRSPRRRPWEVPPPAPTPPVSSTSQASPPPRSNQHHAHASNNASPSQSQSQPQSQARSPRPTPPLSDPWLFTRDEVNSSPSIIDGLSLQEQRLRKAKGINFIYQVGVLLDLPQITLWVAGVFFHRFYMRYSMVEDKGGLHHYNIAATAVFLACKVEENSRKTKAVIIAVAKVAQKNMKLLIDEQSKEYWRWRDNILTYEELMLELLTFDVSIQNPYNIFFEILGQLQLKDHKAIRQATWAFCNDACLTDLPLLMTAREIALAAICFSSLYTEQPIDDFGGKAWWKHVGGDELKCLNAIQIMSDFYFENPLRRKNPALSSPAFHLDTTRRRGDGASHTDSPTAHTPMDTSFDRGTQSPPRSNANGDTRDRASAAPGAIPRGEGSEVLTPSEKRKDSEDAHSDDEGTCKKARLSEDEGEVIG